MKPSHKAAAGIVAALSLGLAAAAFAQSGPAQSQEPHGSTGMQHGKMQHGKMAGMHDKMAGMRKDSKEKDAKHPQGAAEHSH